MAETNRGPLIAVHQNTCCCQFTIDRKYRETVTILRNFIVQMAEEITFSSRKMHRSLQEAVNQRRMTRNVNHDSRVAESYERQHLSVVNPDLLNHSALNVTDNNMDNSHGDAKN